VLPKLEKLNMAIRGLTPKRSARSAALSAMAANCSAVGSMMTVASEKKTILSCTSIM
jgi:hypothetical protein